MNDEYDDEFIDCPYCLSEIPSEAKVCRYCLRNVEPRSRVYSILLGLPLGLLLCLLLWVIFYFS